jgi:hypothetical protein
LNLGAAGRIWKVTAPHSGAAAVDKAMMAGSIPLAEAMRGADFVQVDGIIFETGYVRIPDERTVADDVVMELKLGETEVTFMREDLDDAQYVGDGAYRLKSGALLRFLANATVH